MTATPTEGETRTFSRTFTAADVASFADLSGDRGSHHVEEEEPMVHGLLTATLPTKIGGDMDFVARTMSFEFRRPVYVGEEITCETTVESVTTRPERHEMVVSFSCTNESDAVVLAGDIDGVIFRESADD
ncbi:dehydratase [Haladaptatus sp. W1]|uniref:MaoC/PaaZ C-terminal domain-containing protein n=1 Tax=Haladaptatus sp. W1 TaxID=1897478 RepID=UPI0008498C25|nr:MaoC/PaaZ C-terminal domain-containing protein [Haladaptatus sp. W1]ODR79847.1 dehydratase [Haladaptatus sp. W1]